MLSLLCHWLLLYLINDALIGYLQISVFKTIYNTDINSNKIATWGILCLRGGYFWIYHTFIGNIDKKASDSKSCSKKGKIKKNTKHHLHVTSYYQQANFLSASPIFKQQRFKAHTEISFKTKKLILDKGLYWPLANWYYINNIDCLNTET